MINSEQNPSRRGFLNLLATPIRTAAGVAADLRSKNHDLPGNETLKNADRVIEYGVEAGIAILAVETALRLGNNRLVRVTVTPSLPLQSNRRAFEIATGEINSMLH